MSWILINVAPSTRCGSHANNARIFCEFTYGCLCNFGKIGITVTFATIPHRAHPLASTLAMLAAIPTQTFTSFEAYADDGKAKLVVQEASAYQPLLSALQSATLGRGKESRRK